MTHTEVSAIIGRAMGPILDRLGVDDWKVSCHVRSIRDANGFVAYCDRQPSYMRAEIVIDPELHADEDDVLDSLRHECLHLVVGEFDVYVSALTSDNGRLEAGSHTIERRLWELSCERTILRLERMLDNMGFTPRRLAGFEVPGGDSAALQLEVSAPEKV